MKKFNIVTAKKYTNNQGEEKTAWNRVGKLLHFPAEGNKEEAFILELGMFPTTDFRVFEDKPKDEEIPI